jgi:hypothetical protein
MECRFPEILSPGYLHKLTNQVSFKIYAFNQLIHFNIAAEFDADLLIAPGTSWLNLSESVFQQ